MTGNNLFLSILLCQCLVVLADCPALAEEENLCDDQHIELIPLNASYDTDYKFGVTSNTSDLPAPQPPAIPLPSVIPSVNTNMDNSQSLAGMITMRKIVPIVLESCLDSRSVWVGNEVIARLKEDLYYGRNLIAHKNALLKGRVISYRSARTLSESMFHREDCLKSSSAVGIQFDQLVIEQGKSIALTGLPVHQESFRRGADGYTYGITVDSQGRIIEAGKTLTKGQKDSSNVLRVASTAPVPGGFLVNLVAAPVVMGAVGAASPDLAFNKPLDHNVKHKRLKGMAYGFVSNLPGVAVVQAAIEKGNEVFLNTGDELMIDLTINNAHLAGTQPNTNIEVLAVQGQVLEPQQKKVRLLPASSLPILNNADELALKPFIPNSD